MWSWAMPSDGGLEQCLLRNHLLALPDACTSKGPPTLSALAPRPFPRLQVVPGAWIWVFDGLGLSPGSSWTLAFLTDPVILNKPQFPPQRKGENTTHLMGVIQTQCADVYSSGPSTWHTVGAQYMVAVLPHKTSTQLPHGSMQVQQSIMEAMLSVGTRWRKGLVTSSVCV